MNVLRRTTTALKAARQLGPRQVSWYALYQAGLRSGVLRRMTPPGEYQALRIPVHSPFNLPTRIQLEQVISEQRAELLSEADEIAAGQVRLFGGPLVTLQLVPPSPVLHWTAYEMGRQPWGVEDPKFLWEPARFGWAFTLGRAYCLTGSEAYSAAFWDHFERFLAANPPNMGPNWASAQEVALRLIALLFAHRVFAASPHATPERMATLAGAVAAHANRIPATLGYARAQHNNHLLSEAAGLYAAGCALPTHPKAGEWRQMGWQILNQGLLNQITSEGIYTQHSLNYHRLMLQIALFARQVGDPFPSAVDERLAAAARWLMAQVDPTSGRAPNYGSNDGANLFPLASDGFTDHRPVIQAGARAFLGRPALPTGCWDEVSLWLDRAAPSIPATPLSQPQPNPAVHRLNGARSWALLRAERYTSRPAHADQLHVDLWLDGEPVALDAGTYRYTAAAPWENILARTRFHNTLELDGLDQMQRAGRFLWLDWAQARLVDSGSDYLTAEHNGYQHLGFIHRRTLKRLDADHWQVDDHLLPMPGAPRVLPVRLHWLLPDWPWQFTGDSLYLTAPTGAQISLHLSAAVGQNESSRLEFCLARAGKLLSGEGQVEPTDGWHSPTYDLKLPALSFSLAGILAPPYQLSSVWTLG